MGKDQNTDNRNQANTDNESKTNRDNGKKITDPNNPVANKGKQSTSEKSGDKGVSMTTQNKSKAGFVSNNKRDEDTTERDEDSTTNKTNSNKKDGLNMKQDTRK